LQILVNDCPQLLNIAITDQLPGFSTDIDWRAPLAYYCYKEPKDKEFLERLQESRFLKKPLPSWPDLNSFWPRLGPRWDALGVTDKGQILLGEAKSYVEEMAGRSRRCQAGPTSRAKIVEAMTQVKNAVEADRHADWLGDHYQFANRLAHLYWFRELNNQPAFLVNIYFLNDKERSSSSTFTPSIAAEWNEAITAEKQALGIPNGHKLSRYVLPTFIDVTDIYNG
jgi:hypothetical protein